MTNSIIKLTDIEVAGLGDELNVDTEEKFEIGKEPENEKLYLTSEQYKIGEKYTSGIKAETKMKDYINNLTTNGQIVITKEKTSPQNPYKS